MCGVPVPFIYFRSTLKIKGSSHKKNFKISFSQKWAPTIFIKFCGFIVHSNPNNKALSAFPGKILVTRIIFFNFFICRLTKRLNQLTNLIQILYFGHSCNYLQPFLFNFELLLILRVSYCKG